MVTVFYMLFFGRGFGGRLLFNARAAKKNRLNSRYSHSRPAVLRFNSRRVFSRFLYFRKGSVPSLYAVRLRRRLHSDEAAFRKTTGGKTRLKSFAARAYKRRITVFMRSTARALPKSSAISAAPPGVTGAPVRAIRYIQSTWPFL